MKNQSNETFTHSAAGLRTEYLVDPLGIDENKPRFSWVMRDPRRGALQTGFQVIVRAGETVVWYTARIASDQSNHVEYQGTELQPRTRYDWSVRIWDADGNDSDWSTAWFETGLIAAVSSAYHSFWRL